jgi:hypothetical protein
MLGVLLVELLYIISKGVVMQISPQGPTISRSKQPQKQTDNCPLMQGIREITITIMAMLCTTISGVGEE